MNIEAEFRKFLEMPEQELREKVNQLARTEIIDWLSWNDRNGVYRDQDSLAEFGNVMGLEEGREIMLRQILDA
jgi:hypothetical protein